MNKTYFVYIFLFFSIFALADVNSFDAVVAQAKQLPTMQEIILSQPMLHTAVTEHPGYLKSFPVVLQAQKTASLKTFVSKQQFKDLLQRATYLLENKYSIPTKWSVNESPNCFYEKAIYFPTDAVLHVFGDQHGSFHDTVVGLNSIFYSQLNDYSSPFEAGTFRLKPEYNNHHWIFCGDLTDGGAYGVETLFVLLSVFLENPDNIHIIRGNHEDINVNKRYGFLDEITLKFGSSFTSFEITHVLQRFYQSLPVALWGIFDKPAQAKKSYAAILFCHGCVELQDKNLVSLFMQAVQNGIAYKQVNGSFTHISELGYLWHDVNKDQQCRHTKKDHFSGRTKLSQIDIINFMASCCKNSEFDFVHIFRAHQHTLSYHDLMPIFFENDGVCQFSHNNKPFLTTLLVMPCTFAGIPYKRDSNHFFPGVTQIVPTVLFQEKTHTLSCDFVHLTNTHIPDSIFMRQKMILKDIISENMPFAEKHDIPVIIKNSKIT